MFSHLKLKSNCLKQEEIAPHYQLVRIRDGHMEGLEVNVELRPAHSKLNAEERNNVANQIRARIKSYIGISTKVIG